MAVLHLTKENFQKEVLEAQKPVLIDFFATWCGPCRMVAPLVESIAEEHPEYIVGKVDVDQEPELAQQFKVSSIPTLVVMKNGKIHEKAVGARTKESMLAMLR
ncbi:MAG: thioredoxin [Christensenellales bacterium]|jgi:thioredoxin 1